MKIKRNVALLGMFILLCTFFIVIPVQAKQPTRTVINFTYALEVSGDAERLWVTEDGIWQIRNTPHEGLILTSDADLNGDLFYLGDLTLFDNLLDPISLNSTGRGPFEFVGEYNGLPASFVGKLHIRIVNFYITGYFVCHGSGSLQGLLKGTVEGWYGGTYSAQMVIWT
ncbi:MAG: hypothetical protein ACTSSH_04140 [Candidatus Heimdallarchaeota archaeon]